MSEPVSGGWVPTPGSAEWYADWLDALDSAPQEVPASELRRLIQCAIPLAGIPDPAAAIKAAREALADLMRVEPYVYEGRLEARLTVPIDTWEKLCAALALLTPSEEKP